MIEVVDYDPNWPARFEALRREYGAALARAGVDVIGIEHVGSTSVPGLAAKPIIDCDIVVSADQVDAASAVLMDIGFKPVSELGIEQRWAFQEPARLTGTNTYVIVDGCLSLRNHLGVRDVLRADPELRDRYGTLKKRVGTSAANIEEYGRAKNALVQEILKAAGLTAAERHRIDTAQLPPREGPEQ